jgi:hypothetical protein
MAFGSLRGTLTVALNSITNPTSAVGSVSVSVGDLIVAVMCQQTALTVTGVTDGLGHTYAAQNAGFDAGNCSGRAFWVRATNAGTLTSVDAACTASANNVAFSVAVFEGNFDASPLDANPANNENTDNTSPITCPATGTLAQADELVIGWSASGGAASTDWAATSPNLEAIETSSSTVAKAIIGYQVVAATTTVSPAFTTASDPTNSVQGTMSFKKAAAVAAQHRMFAIF